MPFIVNEDSLPYYYVEPELTLRDKGDILADTLKLYSFNIDEDRIMTCTASNHQTELILQLEIKGILPGKQLLLKKMLEAQKEISRRFKQTS
ncbi:hypothetical protein [Jiulongibacter sp. NS-SX5]|uniref:hypothetical protein n=1 Tax=Jiulongibacter sp. NS-SX5 TaxID=3463854 RepID=UPI0040589D47